LNSRFAVFYFSIPYKHATLFEAAKKMKKVETTKYIYILYFWYIAICRYVATTFFNKNNYA
jgi:hypothetical protein